MELIYFTYNHNILPPELPTRKIPFYDLTFVLKGTLSYFVDERKYTLKENEAIFLPINCERVREKSDRRASYVSFNFLSGEPFDLPVFLPEAIDRETNLLLACTEEIKRKYYPNGEKQLGLICECILENLLAKQQVKGEHALITTIKNYINERFAQKITLQTIGRITYFSPLYCETVFKRETGTSIIRYLIARRMSEAKKLLAEGALPLKQVAETVGFEDYNYFSRTFKKWEGVTPREYKTALSAPHA